VLALQNRGDTASRIHRPPSFTSLMVLLMRNVPALSSKGEEDTLEHERASADAYITRKIPQVRQTGPP
jgi:hypothetical protein